MITRTKAGKNISRAWSAGHIVSLPALSRRYDKPVQIRLSRTGFYFWSCSSMYKVGSSLRPL